MRVSVFAPTSPLPGTKSEYPFQVTERVRLRSASVPGQAS